MEKTLSEIVKAEVKAFNEDLLYAHVDDATQDEYQIGLTEDELVERVLTFMKNALSVKPKKQAYLGSNSDGTSTPMNQGDINALDIHKLKEDSHLVLQERTGDIKYGCLMLQIDIDEWSQILKTIDEDDVWNDKPGFGKEKEPHITILYGFHKEVNPNEVLDEIEKQCENPISVELTGIKIFKNDEYDVVVFECKSEILQKLNKTCKKYPFTSAHPKYQPHMTIAYVKSGCGDKYEKTFSKPYKVTGHKLKFSNVNKEKKYRML